MTELQEHCKRVTAPYKYPREIEFVAELPKTRSGKIRESNSPGRTAEEGRDRRKRLRMMLRAPSGSGELFVMMTGPTAWGPRASHGGAEPGAKRR